MWTIGCSYRCPTPLVHAYSPSRKVEAETRPWHRSYSNKALPLPLLHIGHRALLVIKWACAVPFLILLNCGTPLCLTILSLGGFLGPRRGYVIETALHKVQIKTEKILQSCLVS